MVVGAGIVGRLAAWRLAEAGHAVSLVDPALAPANSATTSSTASSTTTTTAVTRAPSPLSGSQAALGVLMARVFHRSSGRAWRLRQQSHALWTEWLAELEQRGHHLPRRHGLLLLAATPEDLERQAHIAADRARLGIPMQRLGPAELASLQPELPGTPLGALLSPEDGQIDPGPLLEALLQEARQAGVSCVAQAAVAIERGPDATTAGGAGARRRWRVELSGGEPLEADWLVLTLGLNTTRLLAPLGHPLPLEPVLGQALELDLAGDPAWQWPGVVVWRGVNLVPRPDLGAGGRRLWLGATLEPGDRAGSAALDEMGKLGGEAPTWMRAAFVDRRWQGLRARPQGQPAPVLMEAEPGLLIATGHYRNGVLLAPASAAWLVERVRGRRNRTSGHAAESSI